MMSNKRKKRRLSSSRRRKRRKRPYKILAGLGFVFLFIALFFGITHYKQKKADIELSEQSNTEIDIESQGEESSVVQKENGKNLQSEDIVSEAIFLAAGYEYDGAFELLLKLEGYYEDK